MSEMDLEYELEIEAELERERLVGASPIENVLGRVLNPGVRLIACVRQLKLNAAHVVELAQLHQSFGSTSAIMR